MTSMDLKKTGLSKKPSLVPQSKPVSENQVKNNAGGFVFQITPKQQLDRFLILGSDSGTYYVRKNKLTRDNIENVINMVKDNELGMYAVQRAAEFSLNGRAPKNDTCLAVLATAAAFGTYQVRNLSYLRLNDVARTGTHILHYVEFVNALRGWGRSLKYAVSNWYLSKTPEQVAFQAGVKYRQRDGWSHRDVLRLAHPKTEDKKMNDVFNYLIHDELKPGLEVPPIITARELLFKEPTVEKAIFYINQHNLPHEAIPTELKNEKKVWEAMLPTMPLGALIRNLNKLTALGIIAPLNSVTDDVVAKLTDKEGLKKARIHPMQLFFAIRAYSLGRSTQRSDGLTWNPNQQILKALEDAFYLSFGYIEPSGKKCLLAIDISGSMESSYISNSAVSAKEASMVMAMLTLKTEPKTFIVAFDRDPFTVKKLANGLTTWESYSQRGLRPITDLTPQTSLKDLKTIGGKWLGGGTDCALPMVFAKENNLDVDTFVVYTDSETWAGTIHPHVALEQYRKASGNNSKLVVVGMTATRFSIANPNDTGMLDVVGFDPSTPDIISSFSRGDF